MEKARLEKYQLENYESALQNLQPRPPISVKATLVSVDIEETNDPRGRNKLIITVNATGPEAHIDGWVTDVNKMTVRTEGRHGSHDVGERYKESKSENTNT
jgi:hypothetical protein